MDSSFSQRELGAVEAELKQLSGELAERQEQLRVLLQGLDVADNDALFQELRQKTLQIEEVSMKVDEVQGRNEEI